MPDTPERDIEKQLRASAEQRRAEAGGAFELHPATRRLLQGEVTRHYGAKAGPEARFAERRWWTSLWPRVAAGASLVAILCLGVWVFVSPAPTKSRNEAADQLLVLKQESPAAPAPKSAVPPAPAPVVAGTPIKSGETQMELARTDGIAERKVNSRFDLPPESLKPVERGRPSVAASTAPTDVAAAASAAAPSRAVADQAAEPELFARRTRGLDSASPAPVTELRKPAPTASLARGGELEKHAKLGLGDSATAPAQWFVNNAALARESPAGALSQRRKSLTMAPPPASAISGKVAGAGGGASLPVLNSFRFEQTGAKIVVVDQDGSTYRGTIQPADEARADRADATAKKPSSPATAGAVVTQNAAGLNVVTQNLHFNVSGTNRSLRQNVVFTGQVQNVMSAQIGNFQNLANNAPAQPSGLQQQFQNAQSRITGRAVVGETNRVDVDALAAPR